MRDPILTPIDGTPNLLLGSYDLTGLGYSVSEFVVAGTASSYTPVGELTVDGRWNVAPGARAGYATRAVAVVPADAGRFNGTVVVEWLNVSGGLDAPAVWMMAHRELLREGYAYVGVSAQRVGIEGGAGMVGDFSLKTVDPQRYARLNHPGDEYSFDIFGQLGTVARHRGDELLAGLHPQRVLAVGESQSAMFLTTYIDAVVPLGPIYDGFLVHSRFGPAGPLDGGSMFDPATVARLPRPRFRDDLPVPVLAVITETDLIGGVLPGYLPARQPDGELLRVWEIPGAAHADNYTIQGAFLDSGLAPVAELAEAYRPTSTMLGRPLTHFLNFAPQHHYVLNAAIARLHDWVVAGRGAPAAPPIDVTDEDVPTIVTDDDGVAVGGLRTPWVDVPTAATSGANTENDRMSALFGSGAPFDAAHLARRYPGGLDEYLTGFTTALDRTIDAGFLVAADRPEILELATITARRQFAG
ncbi:alpha/beta hydrolase domain-containing protein [Nocardia jiangsuensis]|uniref:Alpha/beta hydrolase domain-containing protein n=1 Tax=Nocardia jiangsuensis TaxID=1691563 RepID=A0ABV8DLM7_9NOCA